MIGHVMGLLRRGGREAREVQAALAAIDQRKQTIRVEVEQTLVRFNTRLTVRRSAVVVAKPAALESVLTAGSYVRFKVPDHPEREVRMEVATPHFTLTSQQPVFLCRPPVAFCSPSQRQGERFDTSRFGNLRVEIPGVGDAFRIVDISAGGLRIQLPSPKLRKQFPEGAPIGNAVIHMGRRVSLRVKALTPRNFKGNTVGMSLTVDPAGNDHKLLAHLVRTLDTQQRETLQAEAL